MDHTVSQENVQTICQRLDETNPKARSQIEKLLAHLGLQAVEALVEESLLIQAGDGLLTNDGTRKRTTGGVFLYLAKTRIDPELSAEIFPAPDWQKLRELRKRAKAKKAAQAKQNPPAKQKKKKHQARKEQQPTKRQQLETAAQKLRQRIKSMEANQEKGLAMTRRLLQNTEKQIEKLKAQEIA